MQQQQLYARPAGPLARCRVAAFCFCGASAGARISDLTAVMLARPQIGDSHRRVFCLKRCRKHCLPSRFTAVVDPVRFLTTVAVCIGRALSTITVTDARAQRENLAPLCNAIAFDAPNNIVTCWTVS